MDIVSTNLARPEEIIWKGRKQTTGIYKFPVQGAIRLEDHGVSGDLVGNKKVHGGEFKACYMFSSEHYPYWKSKYPSLDWNWGMFGENLTTRGLLDDTIKIGDVFRIGTALVQSTIPREPCYKLGLKFGNQEVIDEFIAYGFPGTYVRILEEGNIKAGDPIERVSSAENSLSISDLFSFLNHSEKNLKILDSILNNPYIPAYKKEKLNRHIK